MVERRDPAELGVYGRDAPAPSDRNRPDTTPPVARHSTARTGVRHLEPRSPTRLRAFPTARPRSWAMSPASAGLGWLYIYPVWVLCSTTMRENPFGRRTSLQTR